MLECQPQLYAVPEFDHAMNESVSQDAHEVSDRIQQRLTEYAAAFAYESLPAEAIHAAKVRTIDTLGALIAGFFSDACCMARNLAAEVPHPHGATVIGTRMKTTPDLAAFVNGTTARYAEMTDTYHGPGSAGGHPSDVITPVLAAAEYTHRSGRDFIAAVVLAYEIYLRFSDVFPNRDFDHTNFCCLATAVAAGRLFDLPPAQLAQCIAMAVVPNNSLRQARMGHQSMWRAAASGQAGRAGVFAAQLARAGLEGASLPFEGKAGWCDHVARRRFAPPEMGGRHFKILDSRIKYRPSSGNTIACILAAERVVPSRIEDIERVTVETYRKAVEASGTGEHNWNPGSRESADHSIPYLVAAALMDGTVTPRSFDDAHLSNPALRALMQRIEVVEDVVLTKASERVPRETLARVTVVTRGGKRLVGDAGAGGSGHANGDEDALVVRKFRDLAQEYLGARRVDSILDRLWNLEDVHDVAVIPQAFVLD